MERKSLFTHFIECVTQNYFNFSGRARRREYWGFLLFFFLLSTPVIVLSSGIIVATGGKPEYSFGVMMFAYLICLLPILAVYVRRLHDRGMSGWWILCNIVLNGFRGAVGEMAPDSVVYWVLYVASAGLGLYIFVQTLIDGEVGANQYGEDPKASERGLL